ncbi:Alanine racemase [hydrothermal vent metagenome]|uniref:Alanine racemase n=1 Tax=hydrothermal vent metagenome TaxID=652676 RepID=A0A3B1E1L3_9ZZZZ
MKNDKSSTPLTYVEIDLRAIAYNVKQLQKIAGKNKFCLPSRPPSKKSKIATEVLAVIKADAYGHGSEHISPLLEGVGVNFFGVSDITEGKQLRYCGIKKSILLFESTIPSQVKEIVDYQLMPTVCTLDMAKALNRYAKSIKKQVDIHIKVDTGMGRLGVWHQEAFDFIRQVYKCSRLRIMGIFTHFPSADTDRRFTQKQIQFLYELVARLDKTGLVIPYIHAANSMGLTGYQTHVLNLARPGLMLYGLYPHSSLVKAIKLKPAMRVKSLVILVKDIKKGQSVSYGRTFFTKKNMKIAVIPIGYNDGFFRALSNKAEVLIDGQRCRIVGRVTMDQIMVDVTDVLSIKIGSPVVIIGKQKKEYISADELAKHAGTINYEIVCALGNHLMRVYKS